jgi:hypothetical protein
VLWPYCTAKPWSPARLCLAQVGGSHAASSSSQGTSTKKGPKRPLPRAPFAKYANAPGMLKPWEGGLVIIDGGTCGPSGAESPAAAREAEQAAWGAEAPLLGLAAATAGGGGGVAGEAGAASTAMNGASEGQDLEALREENERWAGSWCTCAARLVHQAAASLMRVAVHTPMLGFSHECLNRVIVVLVQTMTEASMETKVIHPRFPGCHAG